MTAELIVTIFFGAASILIGGGTLGTIIVIAYKAGNWKGEVTTSLSNIRSDINGPMTRRFDRVENETSKSRELSESVLQEISQLGPRCIDHAKRIQKLEDNC